MRRVSLMLPAPHWRILCVMHGQCPMSQRAWSGTRPRPAKHACAQVAHAACASFMYMSWPWCGYGFSGGPRAARPRPASQGQPTSRHCVGGAAAARRNVQNDIAMRALGDHHARTRAAADHTPRPSRTTPGSCCSRARGPRFRRLRGCQPLRGRSCTWQPHLEAADAGSVSQTLYPSIPTARARTHTHAHPEHVASGQTFPDAGWRAVKC